jgi:hypothetical protein
MANFLTWRRLLGFTDFFPNETPRPKEFYAQKVGRDVIEKTTPFFLSFLRHKGNPEIDDLLKEWFTFYNFKYYQSVYYHTIKAEYRRIKNHHLNEKHSLISVESLLNLLLWVRQVEIADDVDNKDASVTLPYLELILLFNDDVLKNYNKASKKVENRTDEKQLQRLTLAASFSQSDLINIDYAQLLYTQIYKAAKLLKFIETKERYKPLLEKLLDDFGCASKEEYLKAIGSAVVTPLKTNQPAWSVLSLEKSLDKEKGKKILENLAIDEAEVSKIEQDDYLILRNKPFQKVGENEYRVIFELFLLKKIYNGLVFKLSSYDKNFLGDMRKDFSEGVLVYETLTSILDSSDSILIPGDNFKNLEREPDFYFRHGDLIILFESKDFFMPGKSKLSYDFDIIEAELMKEGRLKKAVIQLIKNIERSLLHEIPTDNLYDVRKIRIYPVIIVHDSLYSAPALNYWVYYWFRDELDKLKLDDRLKGIDFTGIAPVTIIEIDTLILYQSELKTHAELLHLIGAYHQHTRFDLGGKLPPEKVEEHALKSALSFSEFVRDYAHKLQVEIKFDVIEALLKEFGIV